MHQGISMNNTNNWLPFLEWDSVTNSRSGGISLNMINDQERNMFYEKIISKSCQGHVCIDLGAGTGLLSFLAIKHGASHVYCIEADQNTCILLKKIAVELEFIDKITIINKVFKLSEFDSYDWSQGKPEIIIQEIISSRLFNDSSGTLIDAIDCNIKDLKIIPSKYGCDIFSTDINKNIFDIVVNQSKDYIKSIIGQNEIVKTGVSLDFDKTLQKYRTDYLKLPYKQISTDLDRFKILKKNSKRLGNFDFNINKEKQFPNLFSLTLEPSNQYRIIILEFKLGHNDSYLKFNINTNTSFGHGIVYAIEPMIDTVNISTKKGTIWFEQNG